MERSSSSTVNPQEELTTDDNSTVNMQNQFTSAEIYASSWDRQYLEGKHKTEGFEWHVTTKELMPILEGYLRAPGSFPPETRILDIGCGSSSIGFDLADWWFGWNDKEESDTHLLLCDISPVILEKTKSIVGKQWINENRPYHSERISLLKADCRNMRSGIQLVYDTEKSSEITVHSGKTYSSDISSDGIPSKSMLLVIDKGTLDALHGINDKIEMTRECLRMVDFDNGGLFLSISFAAPQRLSFMIDYTVKEIQFLFGEGDEKIDITESENKDRNRHPNRILVGDKFLDFHFIGDDPARGKEVRLVCVIGKYETFLSKTCVFSSLSEILMCRYLKTNSLLDDAEDDEQSMMIMVEDLFQ